MECNFSSFFVVCRYFQNLLFQKILSGALSASNGLDPDQAQCSVMPDLSPKLYAKIISRRKYLPLAGKEFSFFVQKMPSAYNICCKYSNAPQTNFVMEANTVNPDQTAPLLKREQSDLGPYCLKYRPPKYINRRESRRKLS